jgi:lysozyme
MAENGPVRVIGDNGIKLIKSFEQLRLWPYQDIAGNWTIGYGHLIRHNEHFIAITPAQAEHLLANDLAFASHAVNSLVKVELTQDQFDALCSFVFNVGAGSCQYSTLLRVLNRGDYVAAAQQFIHWDKVVVDGILVPSDGLLRRRQSEEQLFQSQWHAS